MPKEKVADRLDRMERSIEKTLALVAKVIDEKEQSNTSVETNKKQSNTTTKKVSIANLKAVSGMRLSKQHPIKWAKDEKGNVIKPYKKEGFLTDRIYIALGKWIDWQTPAGKELNTYARSIGGFRSKGTFDGHECSAISFPNGKIPAKIVKQIEKDLGMKVLGL